MATSSKIEWTDTTWNPCTGCTKVSPGCKHCYAERGSPRLKAMGLYNYHNGFRLTLHEHMLEKPLHWKKPRRIFVNSMSDLFHEDIHTEFILKVFSIMARCPQHRFQVLTKRSERLLELNSILPWLENVWMGFSVENQDYTNRIDELRRINSHVKFLSLEPLLGPLPKLNLASIDWVIVGGESGPKARPMNPAWARHIRDQCVNANVPFFFKQWGGTNKKKAGRLLEGRTWDEMSDAIGT